MELNNYRTRNKGLGTYTASQKNIQGYKEEMNEMFRTAKRIE